MESDEEIEIPRSHTAVRANSEFMDRLALQRVKGGWSEKDMTAFLETKGYRPETIERFNRGVNIRLNGGFRPPKPKRSEGAMTREEVKKIEDPKARKLAEKYLNATDAP